MRKLKYFIIYHSSLDISIIITIGYEVGVLLENGKHINILTEIQIRRRAQGPI